MQTAEESKRFGDPVKIKSVAVFGGEQNMKGQKWDLANYPQCVIATPGRLRHFLSEMQLLTLENCEVVILDEADRMLDMGFELEIREIVETTKVGKCGISCFFRESSSVFVWGEDVTARFLFHSVVSRNCECWFGLGVGAEDPQFVSESTGYSALVSGNWCLRRASVVRSFEVCSTHSQPHSDPCGFVGVGAFF